jgi:hypothetical protein
MKSIIKNLTPEQKEALAILAEECSTYKEACVQAREQLGIKLSPATLCRFYTNYKIVDDADTRTEYCASAGIQPGDLMQLTENQLQLRLLELASRPNPGASDLRALFQIITRLRALVLSERRVVVAERRIALAEKSDERQIQQPQPKPSLSPLEIKRRVRVSLGKSTDDIDAEIAGERANAAIVNANTASSLSQSDRDQEIVAWTKHLLGKEVTIGDELLHQ